MSDCWAWCMLLTNWCFYYWETLLTVIMWAWVRLTGNQAWSMYFGSTHLNLIRVNKCEALDITLNDYHMSSSLPDSVRVYLTDKRECPDIYWDAGLLTWLNYATVYLYLLQLMPGCEVLVWFITRFRNKNKIQHFFLFFAQSLIDMKWLNNFAWITIFSSQCK